MKEEITKSEFIDKFLNSETRQKQFSSNGLSALFDYLEEYEESTDTTIEFDMVALCCEFVEYEDLKEYLNDYSTDLDKKDYDDEEEYIDAVEQEITNKTTLIKFSDDINNGFIIQAY